MVISVRHCRQTSWARIRSNMSKRRRMYSTSSVMLKTVSILRVGVGSAIIIVEVVGFEAVIVICSVVVIGDVVVGDIT